ncbi:DNA-3-methyladenine glycosylase family protein [Methylobacterium sp. J-068]|uniref:DNA-3-methyladenine glycosylase family protein n=1 Tax=Methylobacterium sp. J-068 TaxID=2836649 RepID=UPI001FBA6197|nr:AlkA N-terminal domain-containing protein [Methylobacterium sp. J-068]MCJ2036950.1 DNA-3-methyladenine glycosylase 2 family protein [Methylobacterium sp. J-068]
MTWRAAPDPATAREATTLRLIARPPYDWAAIHAYLGVRAIPGVEVTRPGRYARTVAFGVHRGTLTVTSPGGDALTATLRLPATIPDLPERVRRLFDLDADPVAIGRALGRDPFMAGLVAERPGLRVPGAWDGFELAVRAILGQQVSVAAATRLAGTLVAAFGTPLAPGAAEPGLTHVFPAPEALVEADIARILNMPRARGAAIQTLAAACLAEPDLLAPGQGIARATTRLKALRGIGDWTAHYIAMRALREPDALPTGDIGLLRALADAAGRPTAKALDARANAWRPWRAYAVLHLWAHDAARSADVEPGTARIPEQETGCGPTRRRAKPP